MSSIETSSYASIPDKHTDAEINQRAEQLVMSVHTNQNTLTELSRMAHTEWFRAIQQAKEDPRQALRVEEEEFNSEVILQALVLARRHGRPPKQSWWTRRHQS